MGWDIPRTSICLAGKGLGSMARVVVAPRRMVMEGGILVVVTGRWVMNSEAFVCVLEIKVCLVRLLGGTRRGRWDTRDGGVR